MDKSITCVCGHFESEHNGARSDLGQSCANERCSCLGFSHDVVRLDQQRSHELCENLADQLDHAMAGDNLEQAIETASNILREAHRRSNMELTR